MSSFVVLPTELSPSAFSHWSNSLLRLASAQRSYAPVVDREDSRHCLAALRLPADGQDWESTMAAETPMKNRRWFILGKLPHVP